MCVHGGGLAWLHLLKSRLHADKVCCPPLLPQGSYHALLLLHQHPGGQVLHITAVQQLRGRRAGEG